MSKSKSKKSKSQPLAEQLADNATAIANESSYDATIEPAPPTVKPTRCYELVSDVPAVNSTKSKQLQLVLSALANLATTGSVELGQPITETDLIGRTVACIEPDAYRVRNGDVAGSVGFHIRHLAKAGILRSFKAEAVDGGYREIVGDKA